MNKILSVLLSLALFLSSPLALFASCQRTYTPPNTPVPSTYFGMDFGNLYTGSTPSPTISYGMQRIWDSGKGQWYRANPDNGVYDWSDLDTITTQNAAGPNVPLLYTFGLIPSWASSNPATQCSYINTQQVINSISRTSNVVTVVLATSSSTTAGEPLGIGAVTGDATFNGGFRVSTVSGDGLTITYAQTGTDSGPFTSQGAYYRRGGCNQTVAQTSYYTTFVQAIVQRYCGKIKYWGIWNEPNGAAYWSGTPARLEILGAAAYPIIKSTANCGCTGGSCSPGGGATNPNTVVSPEITNVASVSWLVSYLAVGGTAFHDVIGFHGYGFASSIEGITTGIDNFKSAIAGYSGQSALPLWDTEGSWGANSTTSVANIADPTLQANWLARSYLLQWAKGISVFHWYSYDSGPTSSDGAWGGLWSSVIGLRQSGIAYGELYKWMVGATFSQCSQSGNGTWICDLTRTSPSGYVGHVVWNQYQNLGYTVPSGMTAYRTIGGTRTTTTAGASVTISGSPILFESAAAW